MIFFVGVIVLVLVMSSREVTVCISIIWGIGLATLIRPICQTTGKECIMHSHTTIDPSWIYSNNSKCMSFKKNIVPCTTNSIPINDSSQELPPFNFNLSINDTIVLLFIIFVIWILCENIKGVVEPNFYITSMSFIIFVLINMYIGPNKRIINIQPTPYNYVGVSYKDKKDLASELCFEYEKIDVDCVPNTEYHLFTQD